MSAAAPNAWALLDGTPEEPSRLYQGLLALAGGWRARRQEAQAQGER